ncbi:MAG TPA: sulfotransferase, partial [Patescibacteria group bacterium]|nr:sulfotransferase [Patescibacteria group bacterium]
RALWGMNRTDEALALFEEAVRTHPQNLVALVDASRALGGRFEIQRAEHMLDRLMHAAQRRPDLLHLAGQSYRMIFRPEKAIDCFRRVLAVTKDIPDAYLELAVLYERRHRVDEAFALIQECLRAAPDYLEAKLLKARLLRRLKDEPAAESLFRELANAEQADPDVRAQAWAEIAQTHDRHEEYDLAMKAILMSKEKLLPREGSLLRNAETVMSDLRNLADSITAAQYRAWKESSSALDPQSIAVLTGFPRSGTTLLEQVLDSHPGLISSDEREAFARDIFPAIWTTPETRRPTAAALDAAPLNRIADLRSRYLNYMASALNTPIGQRVHLDKNPTMTVILPGFLRLFPEVKLLIALRDPRDVVISCFMQYLPLNSNTVYFLTLERAAQRYRNDLSLWKTLRERIVSPWLEVRYEDTVANMEREARRTLDFLGLPWDPAVLDYRTRLQDKVVASPTYEAVSQPIYTRAVGRWKNYQKYLEPCLPILKPVMDALGY